MTEWLSPVRPFSSCTVILRSRVKGALYVEDGAGPDASSLDSEHLVSLKRPMTGAGLSRRFLWRHSQRLRKKTPVSGPGSLCCWRN